MRSALRTVRRAAPAVGPGLPVLRPRALLHRARRWPRPWGRSCASSSAPGTPPPRSARQLAAGSRPRTLGRPWPRAGNDSPTHGQRSADTLTASGPARRAPAGGTSRPAGDWRARLAPAGRRAARRAGAAARGRAGLAVAVGVTGRGGPARRRCTRWPCSAILAAGRLHRLRICLRVSDQAGRILVAAALPLLVLLAVAAGRAPRLGLALWSAGLVFAFRGRAARGAARRAPPRPAHRAGRWSSGPGRSVRYLAELMRAASRARPAAAGLPRRRPAPP